VRERVRSDGTIFYSAQVYAASIARTAFRWLCRVNGDTPEQCRANAYLIAAAPELLEAALYVVDDTPTPGEDAELTVEGYNRLCAAIAKAEGRNE